jgi:hypothetical protein
MYAFKNPHKPALIFPVYFKKTKQHQQLFLGDET